MSEKTSVNLFSCRLTTEEWGDVDGFRTSDRQSLHAVFVTILDTALSKKEKSKQVDLDRINELLLLIKEIEVVNNAQVESVNNLLLDKDHLLNSVKTLESSKNDLLIEIQTLRGEISDLKALNESAIISNESFSTKAKLINESLEIELERVKSEISGCLIVSITSAKRQLLQKYMEDMIVRKGYFITACKQGLIERINTENNDVNLSNFLINSFVFLAMGGFFKKALIPKDQIELVLTKSEV